MFIKLGRNEVQRSRSWANVGVCVDATFCVALVSMHARLNDYGAYCFVQCPFLFVVIKFCLTLYASNTFKAHLEFAKVNGIVTLIAMLY